LASGQTLLLLQSLLHVLQEVSEQAYTCTDCESMYINRLHEDQVNILHMCRFFLANGKLKVPEDWANSFSFLVPMERVFEEFIAGFIERHFPRLQPQIQSVYELATTGGKRISSLKMDIWLPGSSVILDTKYKCLDAGSALTGGIEHSDLYQMIAYAVRRKSTEVHLIYPQTRPGTGSFSFEVADALAAKTITMHVHQVPVMVPDECQLEGKSVADVLTPLLKETLAAIVKSP
jgi:5-methylcytosine-specific restriction enzyme subunit McrC